MYSYGIIQYYSNKITPIPLYIQLKQLIKIFPRIASPRGFPRWAQCHLLEHQDLLVNK